MDKAAFQIENYLFDKILIDLNNRQSDDIQINFEPKGLYNKANSTFDLTFIFSAFNENNEENPFVEIQCVGTFKFGNVNSFEEIPNYFYRNSIAILFPFVRAYVSIVTLQANIPPLILPTLNLSSLEEPLKQSTIQS